MSEQMKKYCLAGKIVYLIKDYVLPTTAILLTGALVFIEFFIG